MHRDSFHGIFANGTDIRDDHDTHDDPRAQGIETREFRDEISEDGSKKKESKITVDHCRDGCEEFEDRFRHLLDLEGSILTEINSDNESNRQSHQDGNPRHQQSPANKRQDPELGLGKERGPLSSSEKFPQGNIPKKAQGFIKEDEDNTEGNKDRREGTQKENPFDRPLLHSGESSFSHKT